MERPASRLPDTGPRTKADIFADLWVDEVIRNAALQRALTGAERFIAGFEDDPTQDGVDALLAEMRAALADDAPAQPNPPARKPGCLADLALFALIPLCLAATAGVIWSHLQ